jgi:hypothetical protein
MILAIILLILKAVLLLTQPSSCQDEQIGTMSVNLIGFNGCSDKQKKTITSAWEDAVKMGQALRDTKVDWNSAAAIDYLGPSKYNHEFQGQFQKVLERPADFGQGSRFWEPSFFKWQFQVRCDDFAKECKQNGAAAATENYKGSLTGGRPKSNDDRANADFTVITFCDLFFRLSSLSELVKKTSSDIDAEHQVDMNWYRWNTGKSFYAQAQETSWRIAETHSGFSLCGLPRDDAF